MICSSSCGGTQAFTKTGATQTRTGCCDEAFERRRCRHRTGVAEQMSALEVQNAATEKVSERTTGSEANHRTCSATKHKGEAKGSQEERQQRAHGEQAKFEVCRNSGADNCGSLLEIQ